MNPAGAIIGALVAMILSFVGTIVVGYTVWGPNMPDWTLLIVIPVGIVLGVAGSYFGGRA